MKWAKGRDGVLTASEEVKTELKSNGEGAEKWRKMDKEDCKRFYSESINSQKDRKD